MVDNKEVQILMDKAKIGLIRKKESVFFSTVVFSMKHVWDDTQPTAYTDGTTIGFNTQFFLSMSPEERIGVLVHEAMHIVCLHMDRIGHRVHSVWNDACDHVINLQILENGFQLPVWVLKDTRFKGMNAVDVYDVLIKEHDASPPNASGDSGSGTPTMNDLRAPAQGKADALEQEVKEILTRASTLSKMAGEGAGAVPGSLVMLLDSLLSPKLPMGTILRKYLRSFNKTDYSWQRPNRRFFPTQIMPTMWGQSLMDLVIAVDISGSVSDSDFKRFISEIAGVFRMMKPKKITFIQFDTKITSIEEVRSISELLKIEFVGRGGTCIKDLMKWADKNKPELLMVFTDGDFSYPQGKGKTDTLWMIHNNPTWQSPGFGKVIHYEI